MYTGWIPIKKTGIKTETERTWVKPSREYGTLYYLLALELQSSRAARIAPATGTATILPGIQSVYVLKTIIMTCICSAYVGCAIHSSGYEPLDGWSNTALID